MSLFQWFVVVLVSIELIVVHVLAFIFAMILLSGWI